MGRSRTPNEMLLLAARDDDLPGVQGALAAGADVDCESEMEGMTPLMLAASEGSVAALRLLLERGADPEVWVDDEGHGVDGMLRGLWVRALTFAAAGGHRDAYKLLSEASRPSERLVAECVACAGLQMKRWIQDWESFGRDREAVDRASLEGSGVAKALRI